MKIPTNSARWWRQGCARSGRPMAIGSAFPFKVNMWRGRGLLLCFGLIGVDTFVVRKVYFFFHAFLCASVLFIVLVEVVVVVRDKVIVVVVVRWIFATVARRALVVPTRRIGATVMWITTVTPIVTASTTPTSTASERKTVNNLVVRSMAAETIWQGAEGDSCWLGRWYVGDGRWHDYSRWGAKSWPQPRHRDRWDKRWSSVWLPRNPRLMCPSSAHDQIFQPWWVLEWWWCWSRGWHGLCLCLRCGPCCT